MKITKKRILHITPFFSPNIGGVETHLSDLTFKLDRAGYKNIVLTYSPITTPNVLWKSSEHFGKDSYIRRFSWIGLNLFHHLEKYPLINFFYITPYLLFRSIFWLFLHRPKVIVIHSHGINGAIIGAILKKIFKFPRHIVSIYSSYDNVPLNNFSSRFMVFVLNSADKVLTQSQQSVKQLTSIGVKSDKIDLYRHWINLKQFRPMNKDKLRRNFGVENKFSVIFVGRMIPQKGAVLLAKVATQLSKINFLFVGQGPDFSALKELSNTYKNIKLFGDVPYDKLHLYYNLADIFCIPTLYSEGWGRVIMEALACGLPVLASNRGAIPEVVDQSVAIIIEPTPKNLENSIKKFYEDPELFQKLKNNSIKYSHSKFSPKSIRLITRYYT
jgi:glycosyltransferase involved in cell wall biosynthesis